MNKSNKTKQNISIGEYMIQEIKFNYNNINFNILKTNKYKVVTGIISFVRPLKKEDFTYYSLINRLISSSSEKYPTKKELSNKMYELYDCSAYMSTAYSYKSANSLFIFSTIHNKLVDNNTLIKDCIDLLKEIMMKPLLENNGFNEKNFFEEKKSLENDIKSIYNNKRKYSFRKLMEAMAPNDILSTSTLGDIDVLNQITPQSLYDFYIQILNDSMVNVGIIGDVTEEEIKEYFSSFNLTSINKEVETYPQSINFKDKVLEVSEKQDIVQAKLMMGFRYDIDYQSKYYIPLIVFNAMYGGVFGSSLFMNIREKRSLTYDISSELIVNKKLLVVSCGVDEKNVELTSDLVIKELEKYKQGNIDESLLENAKGFLVNDLKEMSDSPYSTISFKLETIINNRPTTTKIIKDIQKVTLDDIIEVSNLIKLDTIFTLLPGDNNE